MKGFIDVRRFSKWTVLMRTVACVYRFIANCMKKAKGEPIETLRATVNQQKILMAVGLITKPQAESFIDEWKTLTKNKESSSNQWIGLEGRSPLFRLSSFIHENDLIRIEGRTEYAESLPYNMRFPIILPSDHYITGLIIQHYHERCGHGYRETVKNELRQHYFIPHLDAA
uniref:Integrase zinc-binding domain-containing protein n=1 Tax=Anopheles stephensi TaxID=30069 RepID=A0A182YSV9_ANOST